MALSRLRYQGVLITKWNPPEGPLKQCFLSFHFFPCKHVTPKGVVFPAHFLEEDLLCGARTLAAIPARKGIQTQDAASDGTGDGQDDAEDPAANPEEEGEEGGERAGEAAADPERDGCPDAKGETDGHTAAPPENLATASLATG